MPWIKVTDEPWTHVESLMRSVVYQPGNHNVTADIAEAFEARNLQNVHHPDAQGDTGGAENDAGGDGTGAGDADTSANAA